MSGGKVAQRGFLVQTLIGILNSFQDAAWGTVELEPDTDDDKTDILWTYNDNTSKATQIKSSALKRCASSA